MSMLSAPGDTSAYLRGKLRLAGLADDTPLSEVCDVLTVLSVDGVPADELKKWRGHIDRAVWRIRPPSRDEWGLRPDQIEEQRRLAKAAGG